MGETTYPLIELTDSEAVRKFAYHVKRTHSIGMGEDELKAAMKSAFEKLSWDVRVQWGQKGGSDIEATLGSSKVIIEAKGEGRSRQALGNNFLQVLGQILLRMSDGGVQYGIALPAHPSYVELVLKVPKSVRQALRLDFYLVRPSGGTYEIGVFRWIQT